MLVGHCVAAGHLRSRGSAGCARDLVNWLRLSRLPFRAAPFSECAIWSRLSRVATSKKTEVSLKFPR